MCPFFIFVAWRCRFSAIWSSIVWTLPSLSICSYDQCRDFILNSTVSVCFKERAENDAGGRRRPHHHTARSSLVQPRCCALLSHHANPSATEVVIYMYDYLCRVAKSCRMHTTSSKRWATSTRRRLCFSTVKQRAWWHKTASTTRMEFCRSHSTRFDSWTICRVHDPAFPARHVIQGWTFPVSGQ